jgi:hypothetical protein
MKDNEYSTTSSTLHVAGITGTKAVHLQQLRQHKKFSIIDTTAYLVDS